MTKDILLRISGVQFPGGAEEMDQEQLEMITSGSYFEKNGKRYIRYDEVQEGQEDVVRNLLKIEDNSLELTRRGFTSVHMVFEKDKKNESYYDTPFGSLLVGVSATHVNVQQEEDSLEVKVKYALEINYEFVADCSISIHASSRQTAYIGNSKESPI